MRTNNESLTRASAMTLRSQQKLATRSHFWQAARNSAHSNNNIDHNNEKNTTHSAGTDTNQRCNFSNRIRAKTVRISYERGQDKPGKIIMPSRLLSSLLTSQGPMRTSMTIVEASDHCARLAGHGAMNMDMLMVPSFEDESVFVFINQSDDNNHYDGQMLTTFSCPDCRTSCEIIFTRPANFMQRLIASGALERDQQVSHLVLLGLSDFHKHEHNYNLNRLTNRFVRGFQIDSNNDSYSCDDYAIDIVFLGTKESSVSTWPTCIAVDVNFHQLLGSNQSKQLNCFMPHSKLNIVNILINEMFELNLRKNQIDMLVHKAENKNANKGHDYSRQYEHQETTSNLVNRNKQEILVINNAQATQIVATLYYSIDSQKLISKEMNQLGRDEIKNLNLKHELAATKDHRKSCDGRLVISNNHEHHARSSHNQNNESRKPSNSKNSNYTINLIKLTITNGVKNQQKSFISYNQKLHHSTRAPCSEASIKSQITTYLHSRSSCPNLITRKTNTRSNHKSNDKMNKNGRLQFIQFIIFTLITSSLMLLSMTPSQKVLVSCTNYYWPLRRLNQHHQQHQHPGLHNQHHQAQATENPGQFVDQIPADSTQLVTGQTGSLVRLTSPANKQQSSNVSNNNDNNNNKQPLKRHQLLIGQHYSNFSSDIPYSLIQDSDYGSMIDVAPGQAMEVVDSDAYDQNLSHLSSLEQTQTIMDSSQHHQQLRTSNAYHQSLQTNQQHQQHQLIDGFPVGVPFNNNNHYDEHESPVVVVNGAGTNSQQSKSLVSPSSDNSHRLTAPLMVASDSSLRKNDDGQKAISRALLPFGADSNRLMMPQMQQIKARFNQGCVGGTKCQFFAFCWMSGGSLGASCGLLMTCCVTPSRHEIQPGFYGPVVNDQYCGRSTSKINRIVGGTDASFGQFPWQAFVQVGGSRCGGALISSRHVVTAGHCVARSQHSPSSIKVTLGDYILNSDIESIPHEVFSVVEVFLHPNFRFTPQADRYDVAVLELDRQASYKDNIKPICLPQKDAIFVGRVAYVAGWGALQAGSKLRPKVLQHVAVPVIENQVCENWHRRKGIDIRIYDEMMCAGYEMGQRDACQGDSGGPLMLNQFGVWYLVGIVSAGYSCAKQYQPGIYHRVSSSSDWISSNVYQQGSNK